jgi:two-component system sensor kinase FixL
MGGEPTCLYLDFVFQPVRSPDGTITGILFSGYDVTDRREAFEESDRLRHALLHSTQQAAMGTMAQTIAHELNQPLTAAANFLSTAEYFLERRDGSEMELHSLGKAREQMLRAGSIVRRMRSLVKCGEARSSIFDLERSIDRVIDLVRASGDLHGLTVDRSVAREARLAFGDHVQIEQVLVNLLRNAAQASAGPESRAELNAVRNGAMIEVRLRDWGPGLPPDRLQDLFAPGEEPRVGDGLGVGLSLCRTIVEAHGGRISGVNCPDGGALFSFTLPAAAAEMAGSETGVGRED